MQLANAKYTNQAHTTFDVDVTLDGETFPFSYHPLDDAPFSVAIRTVLNNDGLSIADYVAPAPTIDDYSRAIEAHVDGIARERGYSSAVSCASYVSSTMPQWAAEAGAFIAWRDAVWAYAFSELAKVQSGQREVPTLDAFLGELPVIEWPE